MMKANKWVKIGVAAAAITGTVAAVAGTGGTEFTGAMTTIRDWFEGDLGRLIAVAALGIGLAIGVIQQSIMAVVVGFAMALALSQGPGVVVALLGASLPV